jgi:hypothetical protein
MRGNSGNPLLNLLRPSDSSNRAGHQLHFQAPSEDS